MTGVPGQVRSSTGDQRTSMMLSRAYEAWIRNDDQNTMFAAVIALREPSQRKLADMRIGEIVRTTDDLAQVTELASAAAEQVSAAREETSASTQEIARAAAGLASTAEGLNGLIGRFQLREG